MARGVEGQTWNLPCRLPKMIYLTHVDQYQDPTSPKSKIEFWLFAKIRVICLILDFWILDFGEGQSWESPKTKTKIAILAKMGLVRTP